MAASNVHPLPGVPSPGSASGAGRVGLPCKRPTCDEVVDRSAGGRPAEFCTPRCQRRYHRERARVEAQLREAVDTARMYGHQVEVRETLPIPATPTPAPISGQAPAAAAQPTALQETLPPTDRSGARVGKATELLTALLHDIGLAIARLESVDAPAAERVRADLDASRRRSFLGLAEEDEED